MRNIQAQALISLKKMETYSRTFKYLRFKYNTLYNILIFWFNSILNRFDRGDLEDPFCTLFFFYNTFLDIKFLSKLLLKFANVASNKNQFTVENG